MTHRAEVSCNVKCRSTAKRGSDERRSDVSLGESDG